jgi:hypothetical protein
MSEPSDYHVTGQEPYGPEDGPRFSTVSQVTKEEIPVGVIFCDFAHEKKVHNKLVGLFLLRSLLLVSPFHLSTLSPH